MPRVLLIEPLGDRLAQLATLLRHAGFELIEGTEVEGAAALISAHQPQLTILSVHHRTLRDDLPYVRAARAALATSAALLTVVDGHRSSIGRILRGVGVDYVFARPIETSELLAVTGAFVGVPPNADAFWAQLRTAVSAASEAHVTETQKPSPSVALRTPSTASLPDNAPRDGEVLIWVLATLGSYEVSIVPSRACVTSANHRRAVSHAVALAQRLRTDVWFTPDHRHFLRIGAYRAGLGDEASQPK